ncbi:hypothetical protein CN326_18275 [Bacillus sp. AFS018417]|nr:hypothetical protein CN326_18275 [Bacillus sp. AFS018417]
MFGVNFLRIFGETTEKGLAFTSIVRFFIALKARKVKIMLKNHIVAYIIWVFVKSVQEPELSGGHT